MKPSLIRRTICILHPVIIKLLLPGHRYTLIKKKTKKNKQDNKT